MKLRGRSAAQNCGTDTGVTVVSPKRSGPRRSNAQRAVGFVAVVVEVLPRAIEVREPHGAVIVELQVAQHLSDIGLELAVLRVTHRHRLGICTALPRQRRSQVDDVADQIRRGVGGQGGVESATRVPDEHIT